MIVSEVAPPAVLVIGAFRKIRAGEAARVLSMVTAVAALSWASIWPLASCDSPEPRSNVTVPEGAGIADESTIERSPAPMVQLPP
jgi:hypothetical protein